MSVLANIVCTYLFIILKYTWRFQQRDISSFEPHDLHILYTSLHIFLKKHIIHILLKENRNHHLFSSLSDQILSISIFSFGLEVFSIAICRKSCNVCAIRYDLIASGGVKCKFCFTGVRVMKSVNRMSNETVKGKEAKKSEEKGRKTRMNTCDGYSPFYFSGELGNICGSATRISSAVFLIRLYAFVV